MALANFLRGNMITPTFGFIVYDTII
jgi:hypothetical protein